MTRVGPELVAAEAERAWAAPRGLRRRTAARSGGSRREDPGDRRRRLHRLAPRRRARRCAATACACSTTSTRRCTGRARRGRRTSTPKAELLVGDVRDRAAVARALDGVDVVFHEAAAVGVGQSMYQIEHYVSVNAVGAAVLLEGIVERRAQFRKVVVASSMSIYGEGALSGAGRRVGPPAAAHGGGARRAPLRAERRSGQELDAARYPRGEAAPAHLDLRHHEARPRGDVPRRGRGVRDPGRRAALLQRLRAAPGALESVHRRGGDLLVAAAQPPAAARLRGRPADARLRPRLRHRAGEPARARAGAPPTDASTTSGTGRRDLRAAGGRDALGAARLRRSARGARQVPRGRHPPLRGRHLAHPARARLPAEGRLRRRTARAAGVAAHAVGRRRAWTPRATSWPRAG